MKKITNLFSAGLLVVILLSVFSTLVFAAPESFRITGLEGGNIEINVSELKELPVIEDNVTSVDSSGDENDYKVKGALFEDLLFNKGISYENIKSIRFIAGDGYEIEVPEEIIANRDIILAYEINGEPLEERTKPVRAVIPGERSMYWARNVVEIKIIDLVKTVSLNELLFMETAFAELEKYDYTYYESTDKAIKVDEFVDLTGINTESRTITMRAADGFNKDEDEDVLLSGYIKISGEHAPMFLSPDIPKGMYVKDLLYLEYGNSSVFSLQQGLNKMTLIEIDGDEGIKISALLAQAGIKKTDNYKLTAVDGYEVEVGYNDLEKGIVYVDDKGRVRCSFAELSKQYHVKYLFKITAVE